MSILIFAFWVLDAQGRRHDLDPVAYLVAVNVVRPWSVKTVRRTLLNRSPTVKVTCHNPLLDGVLFSKASHDIPMRKIPGILTIFLLAFFSVSAQYAGRYTDGRDYAVYFQQTKYGLTIRPVIWTATQVLRETSKDKFEVVDRASRGAEFKRDRSGRVVGVSIRGMDGEGLDLRKTDAPLLPVELFLAGSVRRAADGYIARGDTKTAVDVAEQVLRRIPTKTNLVVAFLRRLAPRFTRDVRFQTLLGDALIQAGDRKNALANYRRAHGLDANNSDVISRLARLKAVPVKPGGGWKIPFTLSEVFANPTAAEIASVERAWSRRNLQPAAVREEMHSEMTIGDHTFDVRVVSHLVHGFRHYGAILLPQNARGRKLPVIISAKGVSPTYFPLTLENLASARMMAESADDFIYVVPTFRGEVLNFQNRTFTSEGDRRDALDGATDDAIALLNVALETTPSADASRVCVFGHSRGGNVALLVGIRDKRIDCVVDWAGPTDWFYAMGTGGWTEQELWSEGLRIRATVQQVGGQNIERFLGRAIDGKASLNDVRMNMIASSPLYFAHRLPPSQLHYGLDDPSVPSRNGRELVAAMKRRGIRFRRNAYEAYFYPGEGHDTDRLAAPEKSREFILARLK